MTWNGTFDILNYKGVEKEIQRLFSKYARQDGKGQIHFAFFDHQDEVVDKEILSLYRKKRASCGISTLGLSDSVRSVYVSDSYASLIFFVNQFKGRIAFEEAGFVLVGARFDESLLAKAFEEIPKKAKVNTVFGSAILGRVMDCKIQDLVRGSECAYRLASDLVQFENTKKVSSAPIHSFSLRTYCISQGVKQTVRTFKPKKKGVESFYQLHQQAWGDTK